MDWSQLEAIVRDVERDGVVGITIIGPDGSRWAHNGHRQFRTASVVKIPLMVEVYRQIEVGNLALHDIYVIDQTNKAAGSGVLLHMHDGISVTLHDLLYLMISISDNTATNCLIRLVGMDRVNQTMRDLGMDNSNLGREMKGRPAVEGEVENLGTPDDYARITQAILDGGAASAMSCGAMIEMLKLQQNGRRIGRYVPEGAEWGSKTGSISGVTNDVGFIRTATGNLIISAFCEGFPDQHRGEEVIGALSREAYALVSHG